MTASIDHWLPRNKSSIKPAIFHRHFCVSSDYLLAVSCCLQVIPYALLFLWTSFGFIFYYIFTWLSIISGSLPLSAVSYAWHSFIWTIIGFPAVLGSLALVIIVFLLIIYSSFHIFNVFLFLSVIMFVLRSISCQFHYFVQIIDDHMLYLQIIDSQSLFVQILCWNSFIIKFSSFSFKQFLKGIPNHVRTDIEEQRNDNKGMRFQKSLLVISVYSRDWKKSEL